MGYLLLGLAIGIVVSKYVLPILDMLLEIINYKVTNICTSIQIDTQLMQIDYQEIADQSSPQSQTAAIGFHTYDNDDEFYDDDDEHDERDRNKIGFAK